MSIAEAPVTLNEREVTTPLIVRQRLLSSSGYFSPAPWQYTFYSKLHDLERTDRVAESADDLEIAPSTIRFARSVISDLHALTIPSPVVCPISGGGLGLLWVLGSKQLEVVFAPDQTGSFILSREEQTLDDGDISAGESAGLARALQAIVSV